MISVWLMSALHGAAFAASGQAGQGGQGGVQARDFAVQVPLGLAGQGPWYRLELPLALQLSARQSEVRDVRVFDAAGEPQAFAVFRQPARTASRLQENAVRWFPLYGPANTPDRPPATRVQLSQSGSIVDVVPTTPEQRSTERLRGWLIDTSAIDAPLAHLTMDWNSDHDGFQRFTLEASDDLEHWRAWGEGQVARLTFAEDRIEQHEVLLPGQTARYLRLLWLRPQTAPLLNMVHVFSGPARAQEPALNWSGPVAGTSPVPGEFHWQLPAQLTVERLKLDIDQPNTLAPITVWGRSDLSSPWRPLRSGLLYRLDQGLQEAVQDELALPGEALRELLIRVDERGGGLGSEAPSLRVAVRPVQVVFLAHGKAPYTLAIGNAQVMPADVPLDLLTAPDPHPLAGMGVARLSGTPMIAGGNTLVSTMTIDWIRVALLAALAVGVLVLAAVLVSLLRAARARRA